MTDLQMIESAKFVLKTEGQAILNLESVIDDQFIRAVRLILSSQGKVVFSGMGKSGLIAKKLASTFSSTGTPSYFLHPAEAAHGDLGLLDSKDVIIAMSQSGKSFELNTVIAFAIRHSIPVIAFTGNLQSDLAKQAQVVLQTKISQEACPLGLAPTTSSTVALALGDALGMVVSQAKGFTADQFKQYHPGGGLGKKLLRVEDLMHQTGPSLPVLSPEVSVSEVLLQLSQGEVRGACGIVNQQSELIGIVTDGDIRRRLGHLKNDIFLLQAKDIMSPTPRVIDQSETAQSALAIMEKNQISVLFVLNKNAERPKYPVGIIHIQDLLKSKIR